MRITSPASSRRTSSPGRILYRSASAFGSVSWSLLVTLLIALL